MYITWQKQKLREKKRYFNYLDISTLYINLFIHLLFYLFVSLHLYYIYT